MKREIDQHEILDLVSCAESYGHWNDVCLCTLYDFAKPVSDDDIKKCAESLLDNPNNSGYTNEDVDEMMETLTSWRDKYMSAEEVHRQKGIM